MLKSAELNIYVTPITIDNKSNKGSTIKTIQEFSEAYNNGKQSAKTVRPKKSTKYDHIKSKVYNFMGDGANPRLNNEKSVKKQSASQEPNSRFFNKKDSNTFALLSKNKRISKTPVPSKSKNDISYTDKKQNKNKKEWLSPVKIYDVKMQDDVNSLDEGENNEPSRELIVTSKAQDVVMEDEEDNYPNSDASINNRMSEMHLEEPKRQSEVVPMD